MSRKDFTPAVPPAPSPEIAEYQMTREQMKTVYRQAAMDIVRHLPSDPVIAYQVLDYARDLYTFAVLRPIATDKEGGE